MTNLIPILISLVVGVVIGIGAISVFVWLTLKKFPDLPSKYIEEIIKLQNFMKAYNDLVEACVRNLEKNINDNRKEIIALKKAFRETEIQNDPVLRRVTDILKQYGVIKDEEDTQ